MKYVILLALLLSGCGREYVKVEDLLPWVQKPLIDMCAKHGGVYRVYLDKPFNSKADCVDGSSLLWMEKGRYWEFALEKTYASTDQN